MSIPHQSAIAPDFIGQGRVARRICVADDDNSSRTMLKLVLAKWGYEVLECRDGDEAFSALALSDGPRLALLDWMMPRQDGLKICRRLHDELPCINYYLVLVTARTDDADVISALRQGADDFVTKPFSPHVLQARIEVGFRTLDLHQRISDYGSQMHQLAQSRAAQLVHADRMASLGMLSASVAHEINNPASFLSVNVQTLREIWPSVRKALAGESSPTESVRALALAAEMPEVLEEMEEGVSRIRQITSELRSFSRTGHGEAESLSVEDVVRRALRMCSVRLKNMVEVVVRVDPDLPLVRADATRLEQVFVNLLINAADAMEDCETRSIHVEAVAAAGMVRILVRDTGPGVPDDKFDSLFQPFFTTKPVGKGTGLGLYISRGLVEEFAGTMTLLRDDAPGACFEITLPALEANP